MIILATMDALIEHFVAHGKINAAKFWAGLREEAEGLSAAMPEALALYRHWVREACRETGVIEIEMEDA